MLESSGKIYLKFLEILNSITESFISISINHNMKKISLDTVEVFVNPFITCDDLDADPEFALLDDYLYTAHDL